MRWLADCAQRVSKANKPVQWVSPIGLPIVQPYYVSRRKVVQTVLQSFTLYMDGSGQEDPNVTKT